MRMAGFTTNKHSWALLLYAQQKEKKVHYGVAPSSPGLKKMP